MQSLSCSRLMGTLFCLLVLSGCDLPTDYSLIQRFRSSRNELERLRQMTDEDNIQGRIHADYADPHLEAARLAEYRRLMKASGVIRLYVNGRAKPLEFTVDANGWLSQGDYKGYLYDPGEQQVSSASLDDSCFDLPEAKKAGRFCSAVRSLGEGWWLLRYEFR